MPEGGCICGNIRYSVTGDVEANIICHCLDCRKVGGSTYSSNGLYSADGFKIIKGTPKQYKKIADGGNEVISNFYGDCRSTMWREGATFVGKRVVKVGTLDDTSILDNMNPQLEIYASHRPKWVAAVEGAAQQDGMPS